jgi:AAA+ ATPase superfamily predicted ATPase
MGDFVGRDHEIASLVRLLDQVRGEIGTAKPGRCLLMRGRRRIGKSALTEEFVLRADVPGLFYVAAGASADAELAQFRDDVACSSLPGRAVLAEVGPTGWNGALQVLADALPSSSPSVVVIDEVPYLMDRVEGFEGLLQRAWDRFLCRKPVLLILIGSDLSMMTALNSYARPFHQRGTEMVIGPLNPAEISSMLDLDAASAFDAALVSGGLPLICGEWPRGATAEQYLEQALSNPVSALLVSGERSLAAEFPTEVQAREVLRAIGSGERTFTSITRAGGGINHASLTRALDRLTAKGIVSAELPVSLLPSRERRYRITDPYLRFWLRFCEPHMAEIERRRGDITLGRIRSGWGAYRAAPSSRWSARLSSASCRTSSFPPLRSSEVTGPGPTRWRSIWWEPTGRRSRPLCSSSVRSSGMTARPLTGTTKRPSCDSARSSPESRSRWSRSRAVASTAPPSMPGTDRTT